MDVTVQSRGTRGFSLHWVNADGSRGNKYLGDISREEAWKMAGRKEAELEGITIKRYTWNEFRHSFESVYYRSLKPSTIKKQRHALDIIEQKIHPTYLDEVTALRLYEAVMSMNITPDSARSIMGHARAAIRWAHRMQLIAEVPDFSMPKGKPEPSKGRPLTPPEIECFMATIPEVVKTPKIADKYKNLAQGILLAAFRISEAIVAEWNSETAPVTIITNGEKPVMVFREQKAHRKSVLPCLPDFIDFLTSIGGDQKPGQRILASIFSLTERLKYFRG